MNKNNLLTPEAPPSSAVNHSVRGGLGLLAAGASPVQVKPKKTNHHDSIYFTLTQTKVAAAPSGPPVCTHQSQQPDCVLHV